MAEIELKSLQFRREREASWRDLEGLVSRAESGGLGALTAQELSRLPQLYRATLSALSVARSISLDRALESYLEALCGRAYLVMYRPRRDFLTALRAFLLGGFPRALRETRRALLVATIIFFAGAAIGFVETRRDPARFGEFVDARLAGERGPQSSREDLEEVLYGGAEQSKSGLAAFAGYLFWNNARIGLASFALGGLAGVPVFFLMFNNGSMLGAFVAIHTEKQLGFELFGWLLPHGITEILALLICAGAGLHMGHALVLPGRLKRGDALREAGRRAGQVALGSVLLFFIAGLIEGIFRQRVQSDLIRYLVASLTGILWFVYFVFAGRVRR